ncbi:MAG TPA: hypothetical protein HPP77_07410, partial [Candidatus Hydrogenedentes bacterium]|nr:hypothetical protein [Candidatus Hydrogenedentota bacterium]
MGTCLSLMALVVTSAASFAQSDGDCVSCGGDPVFPEAAEFLAAKGYPPEDFVVLLTWNEVPRNGDGGLVTGYRLAPSRGGEPLDVYSDADGALLDDDRMAALGIRAKNWDLAPVSKETELPRSVAKALAARPVPKCIKWNTAVSGSISLPPIDLELVRLEDALGESTPGKGAKRIGVFQELSDPVVVVGDSATVGTWRRVDGGAIWSASIHSPNAVGQRIHFSGLSLPHAAEVVVYDANDPDEAYGPYLALGDDAGLWSATCFSDEAVVECYVPRTADVDDVLLEIDRTVHLYINPGSLPWQKAAGSCNLDVVCYPDWTTTARGIGGIGLIGDSGYLWCTGTLIADTNTETSIPYFLTADHCVDRQDKARAASSIEVYWLFQT